jgi:hypothetical protein
MRPIEKLPFYIGINEVESWLSRIIDKRVKAAWSEVLRLKADNPELWELEAENIDCAKLGKFLSFFEA